MGHYEQLYWHLTVTDNKSDRGCFRIAEALLATAMGLLAAIPAVIFYNILVRSLSSYRAVMGDVSLKFFSSSVAMPTGVNG